MSASSMWCKYTMNKVWLYLLHLACCTRTVIMPIAPIVGKLRKRLIVDISLGLGLATSAAYAYWYGFHLKTVERRENFYLKLEKEKLAAQSTQ